MNTLEAATIDTELDPALIQALQALYRFAALALADPRVGSWPLLADPNAQRVVNAAAELLREETAARDQQLGWGERPIAELDPAEILARLPASPAAFNAAYEGQFGLLVSSGCPPYETEYIDSKLSFQRSNALSDVAGFYQAFGWTPSLSNPERPDHIALELEFMATLCGMTENAGNSEQAATCREAQASFLAEHLVWWAPALCRLLMHEDPHGYYGAIGRFLPTLLPAHRVLLGVAPHRQPAQPSLIERPEECDGCLSQPTELG